jgi:hypothetical protein
MISPIAILGRFIVDLAWRSFCLDIEFLQPTKVLMTLDKHQIDGLPKFTQKTMPVGDFEKLMRNAGYDIAGTGQGQAGRIKGWWAHSTHRFVESIYSPDKMTVITAYHPE